MKTDVCPRCKADLRGKPIPEEYLRAGHYGEWDGEPQWYSRTIGVEIPWVYDGVLFWQCPDCGGRWHRWAKGYEFRDLAEPYVSGGVSDIPDYPTE
jgi:hypothetical protein